MDGDNRWRQPVNHCPVKIDRLNLRRNLRVVVDPDLRPAATRLRHRPAVTVHGTATGLLLAAHRAMESITLDRGAAHLKDDLMPRYAELIYNGFWFSPEREMLQALIDQSQEFVAGTVRLKLYKGNVSVIGRSSPYSLYDQDLVTFEDDQGAYDQKDAQGFIKLNALRLRTLAMRKRKMKK